MSHIFKIHCNSHPKITIEFKLLCNLLCEASFENVVTKKILYLKGGEEKKRCGFQGSNTLTYSEDGNQSHIPFYSCGHLAMTYTGLASLVILGDDLSRLDRAACIEGVRALQQPDGR